MVPVLADVKTHLRVDSADENTLIEGFIGAAYTHAANHCRRDFAVEYVDGLPDPIHTAILLHVGALYQNREATAVDETVMLPLGWSALLESYRKFPI